MSRLVQDPILSSDGVSGKPGALHADEIVARAAALGDQLVDV